MAAAQRIGGIAVSIVADTQKFVKNIGGARKMLGRFTSAVKNTLFSMKSLAVALAGGVAAGVFVKFTKDAASAVDSLAKTADKLGVTTEALAGLRLAGREAGVAVNTMDMALQRMVRRVAEAAQGTGEAQAALKELGIDAVRLAQMTPDQQLRTIADRFATVGTQADRVRLAFKLFDSEGVALVNVLKNGSAGLDEAAKAAKNLGLAVDRESARGVERAIDAFGRFRLAVQGIFRQIAVTVAPLVELISDKLTKFLTAGGRAASFGQGIGKFVVEVFKKIGDGFQVVIGGFLSLLADFRFNLLLFRKSSFADRLGVGYGSDEEALAANNAFSEARLRANRFNAAPRFSELVQGIVDAAEERRNPPLRGTQAPLLAATAAAAIRAAQQQGLLPTQSQLVRTGPPGMAGAPGFGLLSAIGGSVMGMAKNAGLLNQGPAAGGMSTRALSLADANSSAGYSQRVAALRQTEQTQKKQLKAQEEMAMHLRKMAASISGGLALVPTDLGAV